MTKTQTSAAKPASTNPATAAEQDASGAANLPAATEFDTAGAPIQIVPDVDASHPAVDNDPRANTTVNQNKIDFNDPTISGAEATERNLQAQSRD